jgi:hypothetical protein
VIGLASTAPAYSLAATLGYIVVAVGDRAPAMFVLAFIPMLFSRSSSAHSSAVRHSPLERQILVPDNGELPRGL